jgi:murein DD-endopeptidase MepM/ murein hydrolase activator NlpD
MQAGSPPVAVGDVVLRGQQLGLVGQTGQATGPHLHFEIIIDGTKIDPYPWLVAHVNS